MNPTGRDIVPPLLVPGTGLGYKGNINLKCLLTFLVEYFRFLSTP